MTINSVQRIIEVEMTNNSILKEQSRDDVRGSYSQRLRDNQRRRDDVQPSGLEDGPRPIPIPVSS
ncbi:hypothetical protein [Sphingobacterium mizutaii]|uniref:hypothetical protein n=1 Tax=Sphingobacterium mizutaii TaxID=1010 RepID=UPI0011136871|nr:hypothetical protein [Sphingobacterium mizutaii]